jgi:t-SNARE complex subunit (syntaxin)
MRVHCAGLGRGFILPAKKQIHATACRACRTRASSRCVRSLDAQLHRPGCNSSHTAQTAVQEVLHARFEQTRALEAQMHEVSQLERSMAVELTAQLEQAERLYTDALVATEHLQRGNVQLKKTVGVKRGSGWFLFIVLVGAGVLLLIIDALYPG